MSGIRKGSIRLADIKPHQAYMIKDGGSFIPVTVVCDFTHGWLRGWVRMAWDPLWNPQEVHARIKYISVKPFDGNYERRIEVMRIGDDYYCQDHYHLTLFQFDKGWCERKRNHIKDKIAELQRELEALAGICPDNEARVKLRATMKEEGLYA